MKHEIGILKGTKKLENLKPKYLKVYANIEIIKTLQKRKHYTDVWESEFDIKHSNHKLKSCIAKIVREAELQNNFREKKKLKKEIKQYGINLIMSFV